MNRLHSLSRAAPAARLRRSSVLAAGQNLGAGAIHLPRACQIKRRSGLKGRGVHKKGHDIRRVLFCGLRVPSARFVPALFCACGTK